MSFPAGLLLPRGFTLGLAHIGSVPHAVSELQGRRLIDLIDYSILNKNLGETMS